MYGNSALMANLVSLRAQMRFFLFVHFKFKHLALITQIVIYYYLSFVALMVYFSKMSITSLFNLGHNGQYGESVKCARVWGLYK